MEEQMFNELKAACLAVWEYYEGCPGDYYREKINMVNSIKEPKDYYMLINMFDLNNLKKLYFKLSDECRAYYSDYFLAIGDHFKELGRC